MALAMLHEILASSMYSLSRVGDKTVEFVKSRRAQPIGSTKLDRTINLHPKVQINAVDGDDGLGANFKSARGRLERGGEGLVINVALRIRRCNLVKCLLLDVVTGTGPIYGEFVWVVRENDRDTRDIGAVDHDGSPLACVPCEPSGIICAHEITVGIADKQVV